MTFSAFSAPAIELPQARLVGIDPACCAGLAEGIRLSRSWIGRLFRAKASARAILAWLEAEALKLNARNLWVCASSFNARALRFYERHGFRQAATLPGLVVDGYDEILLRKFPL